MPSLIEITEQMYPNHYKILKLMQVDEPYGIKELQIKSNLSEHIVKKSISFLRECHSFKFNNEIYYIACKQIQKRTFIYILKKGKYKEGCDYYLPSK